MSKKTIPKPRVCARCRRLRGTASYIRKVKSTGQIETAYLCRPCAPNWIKEGDHK